MLMSQKSPGFVSLLNKTGRVSLLQGMDFFHILHRLRG